MSPVSAVRGVMMTTESNNIHMTVFRFSSTSVNQLRLMESITLEEIFTEVQGAQMHRIMNDNCVAIITKQRLNK